MANAVPPFDMLNKNYPNFVSVERSNVSLAGASTTLTPRQQWLGGANGNTCTIRLSRMLNYPVTDSKNPQGLRTTTGADHRSYAFAMLEMRGWSPATSGAGHRPDGPPRCPATRSVASAASSPSTFILPMRTDTWICGTATRFTTRSTA